MIFIQFTFFPFTIQSMIVNLLADIVSWLPTCPIMFFATTSARASYSGNKPLVFMETPTAPSQPGLLHATHSFLASGASSVNFCSPLLPMWKCSWKNFSEIVIFFPPTLLVMTLFCTSELYRNSVMGSKLYPLRGNFRNPEILDFSKPAKISSMSSVL